MDRILQHTFEILMLFAYVFISISPQKKHLKEEIFYPYSMIRTCLDHNLFLISDNDSEYFEREKFVKANNKTNFQLAKTRG